MDIDGLQAKHAEQPALEPSVAHLRHVGPTRIERMVKSVFRWQDRFVRQRHPQSGCIPWSFEILLRIEGADIDFREFQERFDLDRLSDLPPRNNFGTVSSEIMREHPRISIAVRNFAPANGEDKANAIEAIVAREKPVLVSVPLEPFGYPGWHVMPVIEKSDDDYLLLHSVSELGAPHVLAADREALVSIHENYQGGHDIAYVESV